MRTLNFVQAKDIALQELTRINGGPYAIIEKNILDIGWAYIFYWDTQKFLETEDASFACYGNTPLLVDCMDGITCHVSHLQAEDFTLSTVLKNIALEKGYQWTQEIKEKIDKH
jgi:hypothetical protein